MQNPRRSLASGILIVVMVLGWWWFASSRTLAAQSTARYGEIAMPHDTLAVEITLGLNDHEPTDWSGNFRLPARRILGLGGVERVGDTGWKGNSLDEREEGQPLRFVATLDVAPRATVAVSTAQGDFSFQVGQVEFGLKRIFLDGRIGVKRVPAGAQITSAGTEDDFPSCAAAADSAVWCAFTSYTAGPALDAAATARGEFDSLVAKNNGDQIRLVRFANGKWDAAVEVTEPRLDVWRPSVVADRSGKVWVVWSQNDGGNWDLYARAYDPASRSFTGAKRLTNDSAADINAVTVATPSATWVAWQGWRDGHFDIWLAKLGDMGLSTPERVSTSEANDWSPSIAAGPDGTVWVAWDTYDKGNYDVHARAVKDGNLAAPVAIAASPRFEARASIAVDRRNRLWVAFEDSGPNWGKDYGDRWPWHQGVGLYHEKYIRVRCLDNGRLYETASELRSKLLQEYYDDTKKPPVLHHRISIPRLAVDHDGRVWVCYRRHPFFSGSGEIWAGYASYYEGSSWAPEISLGRSTNLLDVRPALMPVAGRGVLAVYSSDARSRNVRDRQDSNIQGAWLSSSGAVSAPALQAALAGEPTGRRDTPIHPDESRQVSRMRSYRVEAGGKTLRYLRGEFHRHTEMSAHRDWDGPLEEVWRYGLDAASMDWIGPGDHDHALDKDYPWWLTQKQIDIFHHPGRFIPMFTYERNIVYPSGHRNIMFARRGIRPLPRIRGTDGPVAFGSEETGSPDIKNLYRYLRHFGGICSSHTSATRMGTDWRDHDPEVEPVVEIFQGHRQNYEEANAPLAPRGPDDVIQGYYPKGFIWNAFAKGYRLGFQASSDHVSTHISYGIVIAEEATRQGIIDAFKKRHSYAAHDNIILDVRSGDYIMGDEFTVTTLPRLNVKVIGTAPISKIEIIRQDEGRMPNYVAAFQPDQEEASLSWTDRTAQPGTLTMYYVRVQQHDHKMAWASPMWIQYEPAER